MNALCSYARWTTVNSCTEQRLNRRQCKSVKCKCKVNRRQCKSVLRRIEGREFAGVVHTLHWVGEGLHCGPQWVGEGWLIWICHRAAIERFEPHRCTRQSRTVLRTTGRTTSIEKKQSKWTQTGSLRYIAVEQAGRAQRLWWIA